MVLFYVVISIVALAVTIKLYLKLTVRSYKIEKDLWDKTILITGASGGIGKETTRELARNGATVHMLCRNQTKAYEAAEEIKTETKNDRVHVWILDTSSFKSVRTFAEKFLASGLPIDILINNAGIMMIPDRRLSEDGLELTSATNHFGHFLLTNLLLDRIKERPKSRIVNVSSMGHLFARSFDPNGYNFDTGYSGSVSYNYSKLANVVFTRELAKRLEGSGVTTNCLHPGSVKTENGRYMWAPYKYMALISFYWLLNTANEGAQTTLYCALAPELDDVSGEYFSNCAPAKVNPLALDETRAERFWEISEKVTGLEG